MWILDTSAICPVGKPYWVQAWIYSTYLTLPLSERRATWCIPHVPSKVIALVLSCMSDLWAMYGQFSDIKTALRQDFKANRLIATSSLPPSVNFVGVGRSLVAAQPIYCSIQINQGRLPICQLHIKVVPPELFSWSWLGHGPQSQKTWAWNIQNNECFLFFNTS